MSYRAPRFSVSREETFQSSCTYAAALQAFRDSPEASVPLMIVIACTMPGV